MFVFFLIYSSMSFIISNSLIYSQIGYLLLGHPSYLLSSLQSLYVLYSSNWFTSQFGCLHHCLYAILSKLGRLLRCYVKHQLGKRILFFQLLQLSLLPVGCNRLLFLAYLGKYYDIHSLDSPLRILSNLEYNSYSFNQPTGVLIQSD